MRKKIFVVGPCLSQSGYGEQTRFALKALRTRKDLFDIYIQPIPWGKTGWIWQDNEFRQWMDERIMTTQVLIQQKQLQPDISLQVTIPNEWKKIAPINIGYTAGIETSKVSPQWLAKGNEMDKILVVSNHAKTTYENTVAIATRQDTEEEVPYRLTTPIEVVHEITDQADPEEFNIELDYDFNFLTLSQWSPRKNFENTIQWWVEEFIDQEVGLVVKTNIANNSLKDRGITKQRIEVLLGKYPERKCKVYLIHGDLSAGQMTSLYRNTNIKSLINIAHGEGFGLPMFEAAREALPIVTCGWSGHLDFLHHNGKNMFQEVGYTLQPIQQEAVWPGVIEGDSMWAHADQGSYKMTLRDTYKNWDKAKSQAEELKSLVEDKFNTEKLYANFCSQIKGEEDIIYQEIEDLFLSMNE
jgi:glycosyltransferase involved in cell wall biosynthesis